MNHPGFKIVLVLVLILSALAFNASAQKPDTLLTSVSKTANLTSRAFNKPALGIELNGIVSGGEHVPLWLISNKYGLYSAQPNQIVARINAPARMIQSIAPMDSLLNVLRWGDSKPRA